MVVKYKLIHFSGFTIFLLLVSCYNSTSINTNSFSYPKGILPIILNANSNYHEYGKYFTLTRAGKLRIHCTSEIIPGAPISKRDLDNIELFFDMGNQKRKTFGDNDDKQYTFSGQPDNQIIKSKFLNDELQYTLVHIGNIRRYKVRIPWTALGYRPQVNQIIGFDCSATDNDTGEKDRMVAWHATDEELFLNTSLYGSLLLQKSIATTPSELIGCPYKIAPVLDDNVDSCWSHIPIHSLASWIHGKRVSPKNFAAQFRTCWNEKLFFFCLRLMMIRT